MKHPRMLLPGLRRITAIAAPSVRFLAFMAVLAFSASGQSPFKNSIVSNDIDFIRTDDPAPACQILDAGTGPRELPGREGRDLLAAGVFLHRVEYADGTRVEVLADPEFQSRERAREWVLLVSHAVGKLPAAMRGKLSHVVINRGDGTAFAEEKARFFVMYADNIRKRHSTHDLEETVFHEAVHATLEDDHATSPAWVAAQNSDAAFITEYAARSPRKEDLPESALFAYTLLKHPGRMPPEVEASVRRIMPHRLDYLEKLFRAVEPPASPRWSP